MNHLNRKYLILSLIVVIVLGSVGGWKWHEAKKERDRQALIHMGDDLKKAFDDYKNTVDEVEAYTDMAHEYTTLITSILDGDVTDTESIRNACQMEEKLMKRYPDIYNEPSSVCSK